MRDAEQRGAQCQADLGRRRGTACRLGIHTRRCKQKSRHVRAGWLACTSSEAPDLADGAAAAAGLACCISRRPLGRVASWRCTTSKRREMPSPPSRMRPLSAHKGAAGQQHEAVHVGSTQSTQQGCRMRDQPGAVKIGQLQTTCPAVHEKQGPAAAEGHRGQPGNGRHAASLV